jgi:hypothetical protein
MVRPLARLQQIESLRRTLMSDVHAKLVEWQRVSLEEQAAEAAFRAALADRARGDGDRVHDAMHRVQHLRARSGALLAEVEQLRSEATRRPAERPK